MSRSRNIKPGFFKNEDLADFPTDVRLLFIGLWTLADREGRLEDRPKRIKAELFPFDTFDVDSMLTQLQTKSFLVRYVVAGSAFIEICNFVKHQDPHYKERASEIPSPPGGADLISAVGLTRGTRARIMKRDGYCCRQCSSEEYLSIDHVVPVSRGGSGEDENLQVLCLKCNRAKGNRLPGEEKGMRRSKHDNTSLRTLSNVDSTLSLSQTNVDSTTNQSSAEDGGSNPGLIPLIPDSLIPDSLIPDSIEKTKPAIAGSSSSPSAAEYRPPPALRHVNGRKPEPPDCPHAELLALWAEVLPALPQHDAEQWRGARADHLRARWRETAVAKHWADREQGLGYFRKLFSYVGQSPFLTGHVTPRDPNKRPFLVELEWLVKPENWAKTVEGKYHPEENVA